MIEDAEEIMLEKETKYFEQKLPELIPTQVGKFVLIKDERLEGIFDALNDALKWGYEKYRDQPFLVKQVTPIQQPLNFANNYLFI